MQITCLKVIVLISPIKVFSIKAVCIYATYYMKHVLGYGVFTKRAIKKGELVLNYNGELIDEAVAVGREKQYEAEGKGSYLFFFMQNNKRMW